MSNIILLIMVVVVILFVAADSAQQSITNRANVTLFEKTCFYIWNIFMFLFAFCLFSLVLYFAVAGTLLSFFF